MWIEKPKRPVNVNHGLAKVAKAGFKRLDFSGQLGAPFAKGRERVFVARLFHALKCKAERVRVLVAGAP
jgi:hypothetical protein